MNELFDALLVKASADVKLKLFLLMGKMDLDTVAAAVSNKLIITDIIRRTEADATDPIFTATRTDSATGQVYMMARPVYVERMQRQVCYNGTTYTDATR